MSARWDQWTAAWLFTCFALAAHLADEVWHGSFGLYADAGRVLNLILPSLELPAFQRELWLVNIAGAILVLFALTWLVRRRSTIMVIASYALAAFVTINGAIHLLAAAALKSMIPGLWTAPLLLAGGFFLFVAIPRDSGHPAGAAHA